MLIIQPITDDYDETVIRWAVRTSLEEHSLAKTGVKEVLYDFAQNLGGVRLARPGYATDMTTCIRFFERLDPLVKQVQVFDGERIDVIYDNRGSEWIVCTPRENDRG